MSEEQLRRAVASIKRGNRQGARNLLLDVLREDPENERAWLIMAAALKDGQRRRQCYETVLGINPDNAIARMALERMNDSIRTQQVMFEPEAQEPPRQAQPEQRGEPIFGSINNNMVKDATVKLSRAARNLHPLAIGAIILLFACFCCATPSLLFSLPSPAGDPDVEARQSEPQRFIPATFTPRPVGGVTSGGGVTSACQRQVRAYEDRIAPVIVDFSELVAMRSVVSTDVELAEVVLALEQPYDEFRAISPPACIVRHANQIESGMKKVIETLLYYTIDTISRTEAHEQTNAGLQQMLDALEAIDRISSD